MTPKEILAATLRHERTEQVAWVPFAGVHAGSILGYTAEEVLKDGDKLFQSLMEVNKLYKPSGRRSSAVCGKTSAGRGRRTGNAVLLYDTDERFRSYSYDPGCYETDEGNGGGYHGIIWFNLRTVYSGSSFAWK